MRILIEGRNLANYLAKCHEALRTGLRTVFGARCYGPGYPGYRPRFLVSSYQHILRRAFGDGSADIVIVDPHLHLGRFEPSYRGLADVQATTAFLLGDYWDFTGPKHDMLIAFAESNRIGKIICYFPQPLEIWKGSGIADRLCYSPPSFDPQQFNDWHEPKIWDVGFLAAGTAQPMPQSYPERQVIHQRLLQHHGIRYLWAHHPGWKERAGSQPLIGRNFSRAINSCRMFVTTGGILRNAHAKIFEALASRSLLLCDEVVGASDIGLVDGETYVKISSDDIIDKVDHYLSHPDECERIAHQGYMMAMRRHTCFVRAVDLIASMHPEPHGRRGWNPATP